MRATGFPPKVRQQIVERSSGRCEVMAKDCTFTATAIHHRRPRAAGGTRRPDTNLPSNALCACDSCHRRIESLRDDARAAGWLVAQTADPAKIAVLYRGKKVMLTEAGGFA